VYYGHNESLDFVTKYSAEDVEYFNKKSQKNCCPEQLITSSLVFDFGMSDVNPTLPQNSLSEKAVSFPVAFLLSEN
jgi:hypothetical protein